MLGILEMSFKIFPQIFGLKTKNEKFTYFLEGMLYKYKLYILRFSFFKKNLAKIFATCLQILVNVFSFSYTILYHKLY